MENQALTLANIPESRTLVVNGTKVAPSLSAGADWRQVLAYFILRMNVKESSKELYKRTLTQYFLWIEATGRNLANITDIDIEEYKSYLMTERRLSALTTGSYLIAVRKFYKFAEARKLYPNVATEVKAPKKKNTFKKMYLHEAEITSLLDYYKERSLRDFAIVNLILRTGLRTIEVVRADIGDLDIQDGKRVLRVWGKGHDEKDDIVVLTDKAYRPIKEYIDTFRKGAKGNDPLFVSSSNRVQGERLCTKTISCLCKEGLKAIGLDSHSYTAHSLRHTTASMILQAGGTEFNVQEVLRHSSVNTSLIYMEMKKKEQRVQTPPEALLDRLF